MEGTTLNLKCLEEALFMCFIWDFNNNTMPDIPSSLAIRSAVRWSLHARAHRDRVSSRVVN